MLLAAVCQGFCRPWAWGWPYGSSDFTYGKTEDQSTLHQAPRGAHRPEPNTLIPVLGLMSPDKLTFEIVNELYVNWARWRNWSLGTKIELKALWPYSRTSSQGAGLPLEDNGVRSTSRYSSVAFLRTTKLRLWFSDVSESSWRELHSIHKSGGTTPTSGRGCVCHFLRVWVWLGGKMFSNWESILVTL